MQCRSIGLGLSITLALNFALSIPARGASALDSEMAALARQIEREVDRYGKSVAIGEFTGPSPVSTGGPRIAACLRDQCRALKINVAPKAAVTIRGDYAPVIDDASAKTAVRITTRLMETASGKTLVDFRSRGLFDLTEIAAVTGATLAPSVSATEKSREAAIESALDRPKAPSVKGTRVSATPDSPYGLEILVGRSPAPGVIIDPASYRPRAPTVEKSGLAFLKIDRGECYAVKILNDAAHDVAVTLTIDGLGIFAFSEANRDRVLIIPAGQAGYIVGWHRTNEVSDAFEVAEYARCAAARELPGSLQVGTIHASFRAAWPNDGAPPADEPASEPNARDGDATARGRSVNARYTDIVRKVGRLREAVGVRYNKGGDPADLPGTKP